MLSLYIWRTLQAAVDNGSFTHQIGSANDHTSVTTSCVGAGTSWSGKTASCLVPWTHFRDHLRVLAGGDKLDGIGDTVLNFGHAVPLSDLMKQRR